MPHLLRSAKEGLHGVTGPRGVVQEEQWRTGAVVLIARREKPSSEQQLQGAFGKKIECALRPWGCVVWQEAPWRASWVERGGTVRTIQSTSLMTLGVA